MEIYIHRSGKDRIQLRGVDASTTVAEAVALTDGEAVWLEDSEGEALDTTSTVADAVGDRGHVQVNRCRGVKVTVNFNGEAKAHSFAPGATIKRIFDWATGEDGFPMSGEDRAEHTLQLCGMTDQPDLSDHIGSLVIEGSCEVCFDLVPKHRFEGCPAMAREYPDERTFRRHLSDARFQTGVDRGEWRLVKDDWTWPNPIIAVSAAPWPESPDEVALRFTVDGYPTVAPTAAPWHPEKDEPLPRELWPMGGRVGLAFNPSWRVDAIYIPCDRQAIAGHDPWLEQHKAYLWGPSKDIVDYLRVIHDLLHSHGYSGVRRAA